jgi:predicted metal-dependent phosphoesterase TrpH
VRGYGGCAAISVQRPDKSQIVGRGVQLIFWSKKGIIKAKIGGGFMERFCDLHTHSVFSDGTYTPAQLIKEAEEKKLAAIALTDHNTVAGLPDFLAAAQGREVEAVAGVEFSTDYNGTELHILALYLKEEYFAQVTALMDDYNRRKDQSNADLVEKLNHLGYAISYDAIKASTPKGQVNRALIAAELLKNGYVDSVQDAFKRLLNPKHGHYTPPRRHTPAEMIPIIRDMGAVAVLAHPYLNLKQEELVPFLESAVKQGLQGMEVYYSTYDQDTTALAMDTAAAFGLQPSGGSDFHGENKPDIRLGEGRGGLAIPEMLHWQLKALSKTEKY